MKNRVVITGVGLSTPIGNTFNDVETNLYNGNTPFVFDENLDVAVGKVTEDINSLLDIYDQNLTDRHTRLAWAAYSRAKEDSNIDPDGIFLGVAYGGMYSLEKGFSDSQKNNRVRPNTLVCTMPNNASNFIALKEKIQGPALTFSSACASSTVAIGEAFNKIKDGYYDVIAVGGCESSLTKPIIQSWKAIQAMATGKEKINELCKPFSADRRGIIISEASAVYVLENLEHALKRNAKIYAEITGYSISNGAESMTKPNAEGQIKVISDSLKFFNPDKEFYINAHGTATPSGDILELFSLKEVLQDKIKNAFISSTKSIHGHCFGASGAMELMSCLSVLKNQKIIPNFYLNNPDPSIPSGLNLPVKAIDMAVDTCLNNSFAFGGTNVVLVINKYSS